MIIVCIRRGDEILLARSTHFLPGVYSIITGFVEAGEMLEHAVARVVAEEVGISGGCYKVPAQPAQALSPLAHEGFYRFVCRWNHQS